MSTYLLTWNPLYSEWENIDHEIKEIAEKGFITGRYSTGSTKKIHIGDRVFLMKLGEAPKGIIASGWAASEVFEDVRWNNPSKMALYVNVNWDAELDFNKNLFPIEVLRTGIYQRVNWTPMGSGMSIPDDVAEALEIDWGKYLRHIGAKSNKPDPYKPDESKKLIEGKVKEVTLSIFERNEAARSRCIEKYGLRCTVCGLDFGEKYGEIGKGFIHVHHIKPLYTIREEYIVDPIEDLRPVCPNCHAMLHQNKPEPYSIEELISIMNRSNKSPAKIISSEASVTKAVTPVPAAESLDKVVYKCNLCRSYIYGYDREKHVKNYHNGKGVEWSQLRS